MPPTHRCTLCPQSRINDCNSEGNMVSHLGAIHNMGPNECTVAGCGRRSYRQDRNVNHKRPSAHAAQWRRPQALVDALEREVLACRQAYLAATAQPAAPPAPPGPAIPPVTQGPAIPPDPQLPVTTTPDPIAGPSAPPIATQTTHGAPTRVYLNNTTKPHMLEATKRLVLIKPEKPIKMLGEYLLRRHAGVPDDEETILPRTYDPPDEESGRDYFARVGITAYYREANLFMAHYEPEEPLKWLGEWLLARSAEYEG